MKTELLAQTLVYFYTTVNARIGLHIRECAGIFLIVNSFPNNEVRASRPYCTPIFSLMRRSASKFFGYKQNRVDVQNFEMVITNAFLLTTALTF